MITAPLQTDRKAWKDSRVGRFTASTIGALMTDPRSKAAKEAGEWSETAKALISQKAVERLTGKPIQTPANYAMKRGTLLEHAAVHLLSDLWQTINECTWQPLWDNCGATPDGLLNDGTPIDIKCPEGEQQVYEFADQVPDGDWEALLKWNKTYAWQIATQALACGTDRACLVYFTDRIKMHPVSKEDADMCNAIMEAVGDKLFNLTGTVYEYRLNTDGGSYGVAYVVRSFKFTPEVFSKIQMVVEAADRECENLVKRYQGSLN